MLGAPNLSVVQGSAGLLYSHLSKLSPQCITTIFLPLSKNVFKLEKASSESNVILVNLSILR